MTPQLQSVKDLPIREGAGEAHVDDLQTALFHRLFGLEEKAFWLEVAVAHSAFVHVGHGADHLLNGDRSLDLREMARLDDLVEELAANTKLHDKENECSSDPRSFRRA